MSILVYIEHQGGKPVAASLGVLAQGAVVANELGTQLVAVVAGSGIGDLATQLGTYGAAAREKNPKDRFGVLNKKAG